MPCRGSVAYNTFMGSVLRVVEQAHIDEAVRRIAEAVQPLQIILFGSAARGDTHPGSDVDVLVVMPEGTNRLRTARDLCQRMVGVGVPVDIVVATPDDLRRYGDTVGYIHRTALREGQAVYPAVR